MIALSHLKFYISLFILIPTIIAQTSYFTDESVAEDYIPCNSTASATTCCTGNEASITLGLCYNMVVVSINTGACTDETWKDPNCFQGCDLSPTSNSNPLYRCDMNNWCCSPEGDLDSCCNFTSLNQQFSLVGTGKMYQLFNGSAWAPGFTMVPTSVLATSMTNYTTVEAGPTVTTSISSNGTPYSSGHEAFRVGVGVGVGIGVPLLAALTGVWVLLVKEKRRTRLLQSIGDGGISEGHGFPKGDAGHGQELEWQEMPAIRPVRELP